MSYRGGAAAVANIQGREFAFKLKKLVDPRVETESDEQKEFYGYVGAQYWNRYAIPATSCSPTEIKWTNIQSPGPRVMWDKRWYIEYVVNVDIENMPVTEKQLCPFRGADSAIMFRPYPLHQCTDTIHVSLNNRVIQSQPMESLNARMEYWPQSKLKLSNGMCPHRKYNGQTFADMDLRKGNSPFCNMGEFTDQDYPNTALIDIERVWYDPGEVAIGNNFEQTAFPRSVIVNQPIVFRVDHVDGDEIKGILQDKPFGPGNWNEVCVSLKAFRAFERYIWARDLYARKIMGKENGIIKMSERYDLKQECAKQAAAALGDLNPNNEADIATLTNFDANAEDDDGNAVSMAIINEFVDEPIDLDLLTETDEANILAMNGLLYRQSASARPNIYYYGNCIIKNGAYHLRAKIREPVIAEPLDFTSSAEFGSSFWNITSVELKYTLSTYLRNMLAIDEYKLMQNYEAYWLYKYGMKFVKGYNKENYRLLIDDNIKVSLDDKPFLIYNIATPFTPPGCPFVTHHKQFQRYESHITPEMRVKKSQLSKYVDPYEASKAPITAVSEAYPLQFHPNSIFIWVAQSSSDRYNQENRYTRVDSYAKINRIRICYGNTSNILAQFDDHELFQMSLRNGLQDRTFLDWNATNKSITVPTDLYGNSKMLGFPCPSFYDTVETVTNGDKIINNIRTMQTETSQLPCMNRYAGIGSVVRLIPGIDILTGDTTNPLIAGMHAYSQTIKIEVDFIPLNVYEKTNYSLYVMFEYDGVCTINPNTCDLGMIAIDSWTQLKSTPKARTMRESYCYGAGLAGAAMRASNVSRTVRNNIGSGYYGGGKGRGAGVNAVGNLGRNANTCKMRGGQVIEPQEFFDKL